MKRKTVSKPFKKGDKLKVGKFKRRFKVGDTVEILPNDQNAPVGHTGKILDLVFMRSYVIQGKNPNWYITDECLKLVTPKKKVAARKYKTLEDVFGAAGKANPPLDTDEKLCKAIDEALEERILERYSKPVGIGHSEEVSKEDGVGSAVKKAKKTAFDKDPVGFAKKYIDARLESALLPSLNVPKEDPLTKKQLCE